MVKSAKPQAQGIRPSQFLSENWEKKREKEELPPLGNASLLCVKWVRKEPQKTNLLEIKSAQLHADRLFEDSTEFFSRN